MLCPPEKVSRRICPRHQVVIVQPCAVEGDFELVPLEQNRRGFDCRPAPLTEAEREAFLAGNELALEVGK